MARRVQKMKTVIMFLAFTFGCLLPLMIWRGSALVSAQDEGGTVHACVASNGVMRVIPFSSVCPPDQRSILLQKPDSTVDVDQQKDKKKIDDLSSADKAMLNDLGRRLSKLEELDCS